MVQTRKRAAAPSSKTNNGRTTSSVTSERSPVLQGDAASASTLGHATSTAAGGATTSSEHVTVHTPASGVVTEAVGVSTVSGHASSACVNDAPGMDVSNSRLATGNEAKMASCSNLTQSCDSVNTTSPTPPASASSVLSAVPADHSQRTSTEEAGAAPQQAHPSATTSQGLSSAVSMSSTILSTLASKISTMSTDQEIAAEEVVTASRADSSAVKSKGSSSAASTVLASHTAVSSALPGVGSKYVVIQAPSRIQAQSAPGGSATTQGSVVRYTLVFTDKPAALPATTSTTSVTATPVRRVAGLVREPATMAVAADASAMPVSQQPSQVPSLPASVLSLPFYAQPTGGPDVGSTIRDVVHVSGTTSSILAATLADARPAPQPPPPPPPPSQPPHPPNVSSGDASKSRVTNMIEVPGHGLWKVSLVEGEGEAKIVGDSDVRSSSAVTHSQSQAPVDSVATQSVVAAEEEECPGQVTWSRDATLKLIELYKEHQVYLNDHHYKKKSVWEIIATRLRKETSDPTQYRWNQAENKWKNITKKYRDCVDNNRRHGTNVRCRFYDEIAAVYNYNPDDQAQKTAAEGLRALSSTRPQVIKLSDMGESSTATHQNYGLTNASPRLLVRTKHERPSADDESFINGTGAEDAAVPLLAKKKKYARLDSATTATAQQHTPLTSATVNLVSAPLVSASPSQAAPKVSQCDDILAVLKELREDRQRQEKARMDRLENMHQEKMQLFRQFLDLLKQSKQT